MFTDFFRQLVAVMNKADTFKGKVAAWSALFLLVASGLGITVAPEKWRESPAGKALPFATVAVVSGLVGWCAARTFYQAVRIGRLRLVDPIQGIYKIEVRNTGSLKVKPEVTLHSATYIDGTPTEQFEHSMKLRETNRQWLESHGEYTDVPVLKHLVNPSDPGEWALGAFVMASQEPYQIVPFTKPPNRRCIEVTIGASCGDEGRIAVKRTFILIPRFASHEYDIDPKKRWLLF
jgi:hypothetical protein